jgi:cytochrome c biogenesis protein ResB
MGLYVSSTNPDAPAGQLVLDDVGITLNFIGPDENPWNQPELDQLQLGTEQLFVQARSEAFAPGVTLGATIDPATSGSLGDINVEFLGYGRYSLFQVARNPGIPIFVVASIILEASLLVTFYLPHRRLRAIIAPTPNGGALGQMAPLARRDWSGQREFLQLVEQLKQRPSVEVTVQA